MGCDIHAYCEWKGGPDKEWFGGPEIELHRHYAMFSVLAGVRSKTHEPEIPLRGLPDDASWEVRKEFKEWEGDAHSISWMTTKEIRDLDWSSLGGIPSPLREALPYMEALPWVEDDIVRLVFWFDN